MGDIGHELAIADLLAAGRRGRWRELLGRGSDEARRKALSILDHGPVTDERYATRVPPAHARDELPWILAELRRRGAPDTCHVISTDGRLDGRSMPLEEALASVLGGQMGTLLSCLPGRLAFYEGEEPGDRCVLWRPSRT